MIAEFSDHTHLLFLVMFVCDSVCFRYVWYSFLWNVRGNLVWFVFHFAICSSSVWVEGGSKLLAISMVTQCDYTVHDIYTIPSFVIGLQSV